MDDGGAGEAGEQGGVADLPGAVLLRGVQNGLAVEADELRGAGQQGDGHRVVFGEFLLGGEQARVTRAKRGCEVEQGAQIGAQRVLVMQGDAGGGFADGVAVGFEPCGVHAVE